MKETDWMYDIQASPRDKDDHPLEVGDWIRFEDSGEEFILNFGHYKYNNVHKNEINLCYGWFATRTHLGLDDPNPLLILGFKYNCTRLGSRIDYYANARQNQAPE